MLQTLAELLRHRPVQQPEQATAGWSKLQVRELVGHLPFWSAADIRRILDSLQALGMIKIGQPRVDDHYWVALEVNGSHNTSAPQQHCGIAESPRVLTDQGRRKPADKLIAPDWQPDDNWIRLCHQHAIPEEFTRSLIPEFIGYWRARGEVRSSWGNTFYKYAVWKWREQQAHRSARPIASDWQPSQQCYEMLQLAEIDQDYARSRVPAFIMFWRDTGQARASWNTVFLQFIKQGWASHQRRLQSGNHNHAHAQDQHLTGSTAEKVRARLEQLADRSWAD